jgi:hypothetical protein
MTDASDYWKQGGTQGLHPDAGASDPTKTRRWDTLHTVISTHDVSPRRIPSRWSDQEATVSHHGMAAETAPHPVRNA